MSTSPDLQLHAPHQTNGHAAATPLHRVRAVRVQQGMSRRAAARRLGVDLGQLDDIEDPSRDLSLSAIYVWQQMLQVPIEELLVESDAPLSRPVMERAQMLNLMKTAVTIRNRAKSNAVRHLAEMLVDQLSAILPEMKEIGPWSSHCDTSTTDGDNGFDRARAERDFLGNTFDS